VAETSSGVKAKSGGGRSGDGAVSEGKDDVAMCDTSAPRSTGLVTKGPDFAHIDKSGCDPGGLEEVDNAVGDPALGNAIQGETHAWVGEGNAIGADADGIEADASAGFGKGGRGRALWGAAGGEVGSVETPNGLDRRVKGSVCGGMVAAAVFEYGDKFTWRCSEGPGTVQLREGAFGAVETEDRFQAGEFGGASGEQALGGSAVGVVEDEGSGSTKGAAAPSDDLGGGVGGAQREGKASGGGEQAEGAAAGEPFSCHEGGAPLGHAS
jgi:hypothetical protein